MEDLKLDDEPSAPISFGVGPLLTYLANREMGLSGRKSRARKSAGISNWMHPTSDEIAEERLVRKEPLGVLPCKLMGNPTKSTFLMVFSPDKELLASTHGDHNIYISEVKTGECIQTLRGHPRYVYLFLKSRFFILFKGFGLQRSMIFCNLNTNLS